MKREHDLPYYKVDGIRTSISAYPYFLFIVAFVALVGIWDASAAITGKISGVVTAEATRSTVGKCYGNNCRDKQHHNDKRLRLLCPYQYPTGRL